MFLKVRNVNEAFRFLVEVFANEDSTVQKVRTKSRAGDVIQITDPVTVQYAKPKERVLFNRARDANPFFHLFESLWMLAGRNDVSPMAYYSSGISDIASDDGVVFNGAYGYRWRQTRPSSEAVEKYYENSSPYRNWPDDVDQLPIIIDQLKRKPESRRVVLQMWNVEDDLLKIDTTKDVCCNTNAYFLIRKETHEEDTGGFDPAGRSISEEVEVKFLDMTVCNRSNDLIWGMLGANVVHFSFLQEYLAAHIGVEVGVYNQFTNNLHVYTERFKPEVWLADKTMDAYLLEEEGETGWEPGCKFPLVKDPAKFDEELQRFNKEVLGVADPTSGLVYEEPFFEQVALPAAYAFREYKRKDYAKALEFASNITPDDWGAACYDWIHRRQKVRSSNNPYAADTLEGR